MDNKPGVFVVDVYNDIMNHGQQRCYDLEEIVRVAFLHMMDTHIFTRFETREYCEDKKVAKAGYYMRADSQLATKSVAHSEILGHATFTLKDSELLPDFEVVKNDAVIASGRGVVAWAKFLQEHKALASWCTV